MGGGRICSAKIEAKLNVSCKQAHSNEKKMYVFKGKIRMASQPSHSGTALYRADTGIGKCQTFIGI